ncbi:FAR1-related sequence 5-like protein [Tanacetum coccineum]
MLMKMLTLWLLVLAVIITDSERLIGEDAKNQAVEKQYLTFEDKEVQRDLKLLSYKIMNKDGNPYIQVQKDDENKVCSPEEIGAMILTKMKETAETYLGYKVKGAVITVPCSVGPIISPMATLHLVGSKCSCSVLPVLGTVYDSLDECIEVYRKYASEAGFGEGCPKDVWLNTLDPKKNDRQVRSSNFRVCGCKARVCFDMSSYPKYTLTTFDVEHNHELDRVEYKHLSKAERKLTYNEQLFIIKAANANIGAVRAHNLYTGFESDAQMLITRMEQRQEFTKEFSFDYFVEDA